MIMIQLFCTWNSIRGERTVKSLRLSKALTVPETTTIYEACRRMAARKVDALLLTDSNALLCGILTDKVNLGLLFVTPTNKKRKTLGLLFYIHYNFVVKGYSNKSYCS